VAETNMEDWLVSDGERVVGPVSLDLIAKGIDRGRLSLDMIARRRDSSDWIVLGELEELRVHRSGWGQDPMAEDLACISAAETRGEAALYLLAAAVRATGALGGLVHLVREDGDFVTTCAHGPRSTELLGGVIAGRDAAAVALDGADDPRTAWAWAMTAMRLRALGFGDVGSIAVPIREKNALIGFLELAASREKHGFTTEQVQRVERLGEAFSLRTT
jgi:hypothetical protein